MTAMLWNVTHVTTDDEDESMAYVNSIPPQLKRVSRQTDLSLPARILLRITPKHLLAELQYWRPRTQRPSKTAPAQAPQAHARETIS